MDCLVQYQNLNIDEICRICLSKQDQMTFMSEAGLPDLLFECASIQLSAEDILYLVCSGCANEVSRWYIFKQQLVRSFEIGKWLIRQKNLKTTPECQVIKPVSNIVIEKSEYDRNNEELVLECKDVNSSTIKIEPKEKHLKAKKALYNLEPASVTLAEVNIVQETFSDKYVCSVCEKSCTSKKGLVSHERIHKEINKYVCDKCGEGFKTSQTLSNHMKEHNNIKKYSCDHCDKTFYKRYNMTLHIRMHTGEKPHKCKDCEKAFSRPLLLRNHIKQTHTNEKKYVCPTCEKTFIDGWQLKVHVRTHTGEKPHKCPHCDMAFSVTSSLHSHIRYKHTLEKNYICSMCAKAFTAKHTLDDHMRIHTGKKKPLKHDCHICKKKYDSTSSLKYHIRAAHTGEKPFVCGICEKRFLRKQHLTAHIRNHTGEKPYMCVTCGKTFVSSSTFSIHKRTHNGEKPFVCTVCNISFIQSAGLKQHMRTRAHINKINA